MILYFCLFIYCRCFFSFTSPVPFNKIASFCFQPNTRVSINCKFTATMTTFAYLQLVWLGTRSRCHTNSRCLRFHCLPPLIVYIETIAIHCMCTLSGNIIAKQLKSSKNVWISIVNMNAIIRINVWTEHGYCQSKFERSLLGANRTNRQLHTFAPFSIDWSNRSFSLAMVYFMNDEVICALRFSMLSAKP